MKKTLLVAALALTTAGGAALGGQGKPFHFNGTRLGKSGRVHPRGTSLRHARRPTGSSPIRRRALTARGRATRSVAFPVTINVYFHIIKSSVGDGAVTNHQINQQIEHPQRRVRRHGDVRPRGHGHDRQRRLVRDGAGHDGRAGCEGRAADRIRRRSEYLHGESRQQPARLGDVPVELPGQSRRRRRRHPLLVRCRAAARSRTTKATPPRTKSATGSACTTPSRAAAAARRTRTSRATSSPTRRPKRRPPSVAR